MAAVGHVLQYLGAGGIYVLLGPRNFTKPFVRNRSSADVVASVETLLSGEWSPGLLHDERGCCFCTVHLRAAPPRPHADMGGQRRKCSGDRRERSAERCAVDRTVKTNREKICV